MSTEIVLIEENVESICNRLVQTTTRKNDFSNLEDLCRILEESMNVGLLQILKKWKIVQFIGHYLKTVSVDAVESRCPLSIKLCEACLRLLVTIISSIDVKFVAENHFDKIIVHTLYLLGFAQTYHHGMFKHNFPANTMKYLKKLEGLEIKTSLEILDASENIQFDDGYIQCSPKYAMNSKSLGILAYQRRKLWSELSTKTRPVIEAHVRITHWNAVNLCFMHVINDHTDYLLDSLQNLTFEKIVALKAEPLEGDSVLAWLEWPNSSHSRFIRGKVVKTCGSVLIYAIDYGFTKSFQWKKLFKTPNLLCKHPPMAIPCLFDVCPPIPSQDILNLGIKFLKELGDINSEILSEAIIKSRNMGTIFHLLDIKFGATLDEWINSNQRTNETVLVTCCKVIDLIATDNIETKITFVKENGIKSITQFLDIEALPRTCAIIFMKIILKALGAQKQELKCKLEYQQGEFIDKLNTGVHILDDSRGTGSIDVDKLEERICALANHLVGGRISFGVAKSKNVVGICLTQKDRDELRLGIDKIITQRIRPMIPLDRIKFFIVPLRGLKEDLYVANVDITGMSRGIHSTHDGRYMIVHSQHGHITEMSMNELMNMVASKEKQSYMIEIEMLKSTIQRLKAA